MSFVAAVQALQAHALSLSGVMEAPTYPPESINQFPFAVAYPANGRILGVSAQFRRELHTVFVEFHCARTILPTAVEQAITYLTGFPPLLTADPTLGGAVQTVLMDADQPITYEFGRLNWNGIDTIGIRFRVTLKL